MDLTGRGQESLLIYYFHLLSYNNLGRLEWDGRVVVGGSLIILEGVGVQTCGCI